MPEDNGGNPKLNSALPPDDDGRVIASMELLGELRRPHRWQGDRPAKPSETLDRSETRTAVWGAIKAALLVALIFSAVIVLFALFCTGIWLR